MLNNHNKRFLKTLLVVLASTVVAACAHQSKVPPSEGHIDQVDTISQPKATSAAVQAPIPKPVRTSPVLPPPKPAKKAQTYSVVVNEVPVKEILFALARESKINVDIDPAIQGRATLNAVDQTLPAILERLSRQVDLTYRMEGNVLVITPDQPVLRTYKIDYVNITRDTESSISADGQIASSFNVGGQSSSNSNNSKNGSETAIDSESKNHLWESLIQNVKDLLAETDKEVIVSRFGTTDERENNLEASTTDNQQDQQTAQERLENQRTEYQTFLAANVIANPETGVISVRATNRQHQKVQEFIDQVMRSARKQVLIEATIVEVQLSDSFQAGIDWSRLNNTATNSGFVFGQTLGSKGVNFNTSTGAFSAGDQNALGDSTSDGFVAGYINPISSLGNIAASVTLLKQFGDTKVLSSPKLMVLNNQTAVLKVVDNIVYFNVEAQQSQGTNGSANLATFTTTPQTVPVGIVMSVIPQISDGENVNINVRPSVTRLIGFKADPNPSLGNVQNLVPEIQVREMESILQIRSGNIAVLGGLMQDEIYRNTDKVPGLSEIPGVGNVFKGKNDATKKTELVIFLRPIVVSNASLESEELSAFKKYLPAQQLQKVLEEAN